MKQQLKTFNYFLAELVKRFDPMQVICFGHHHTSHHLESFFTDKYTVGHSDYLLLLIMNAPASLNHVLQEFADRNYDFGAITMLVHSPQAVVESLSLNNRFFTTVLSNGSSLYRKQEFALKTKMELLQPNTSLEKETFYFNHHMQLAKGFMGGASECMANTQYTVCVFNLHQVVEQCCMALLSVFLDYRCSIHNIKRMLTLCCCFSSKPLSIFISGSTHDARLFDILIKSYSKSRYRTDFRINEEDAKGLYTKVTCLLGVTNQMGADRIASSISCQGI
ncbi:MAG: HEPN domain-containing protein [Chitinophagaceae bacterium]|nr:MAG: HEPN domain-containing protein [Chitinophagaceae bacterium]